MGCSKGVCCKWTYIVLSIFVFLLGFLAFAPMYVTGPPGQCTDNDTGDLCQCQPWDSDCEEPEDDCITSQCFGMKSCCEADGGTWENAATTGGANQSYMLNIHGHGPLNCQTADDFEQDDDPTNSWYKLCARAGPDKTIPGETTWLAVWNGARTCQYALESESDDCDWEAGKDTCECTYWHSGRGWKDQDCAYTGCDEENYACTCDDVACELSDVDVPTTCDCDTAGGEVLDCHLVITDGDGGCLEWGAERSDSADCIDDMEDYCPGSAVDFCEEEKAVFQGFFQAFVLFILAQVVLALAAVLSILSICTSKISCLKGCFTKFARLIVGFALLAGSVFASAAFALFDLKGVQSWATLINEDGMFNTPFVLCSGQPGVLVENTTMEGVSVGCLKRTPTFYLYVLLVVTLSWTACLAAFATVCCCNPEKAAEEEGVNEVGYQE